MQLYKTLGYTRLMQKRLHFRQIERLYRRGRATTFPFNWPNPETFVSPCLSAHIYPSIHQEGHATIINSNKNRKKVYSSVGWQQTAG